MSGTDKNNLAKHLYKVISVKKTAPPEGMGGKNWHNYVIQRGSSIISGLKPGSLKAVTAHAKQVAADLNARTGMSAGSLYSSRRRAT